MIFIVRCLTANDAENIFKLDAQVYNDAYQVSKDVTVARLRLNPYTDIGVYAGNELAAYISLLPISQALYRKIRHGLCDEDAIEKNILSYCKTGTYYAYLSSIVINKKRFPHLRVKFLIESLQNHIIKLRKRGIFIDKIVATAVSIGGQKSLIKMRFKWSKGKTYLYSCFNQGCEFIIKKVRLNGFVKYFRTSWAALVDRNEKSESEWDTDT